MYNSNVITVHLHANISHTLSSFPAIVQMFSTCIMYGNGEKLIYTKKEESHTLLLSDLFLQTSGVRHWIYTPAGEMETNA